MIFRTVFFIIKTTSIENTDHVLLRTLTIAIIKQILTIIYLNNAIDVKAHDKLWDVTHQIVEPVVDTCQNVDWLIVVPEKQSEN